MRRLFGLSLLLAGAASALPAQAQDAFGDGRAESVRGQGAGGRGVGGQGERRTEIAPYLEVDQSVLVPLSGPGDTVTYTRAAAGIEATVRSASTQAQIDARYEHAFSWNDRYGDQDYLTGIARSHTDFDRGQIGLDLGALGTRTRYGSGGGFAGYGDGNTSDLYSVYASPSVATNIGDLGVAAAYQLGYTKIVDHLDGIDGTAFTPFRSFDDSLSQVASASIGRSAGGRPFGWTISGGFEREDASVLDQRYQGYNVRGDVTVPISPTVALVGGVGYEDIEIGQRDALTDADGVPLVDGNGRFVTDKDSPRRLSYDTDGLIWDAGILWRPSARTSLEARVGRRYGSMTYVGQFNWQPTERIQLQVAAYDGIQTFGRLINGSLSQLSVGFDVTRNPITGDINSCASGNGQDGGGVCFNPALQGLGVGSFRNRGVGAQLSADMGLWRYAFALGYAQREYIAPTTGALAGIDGSKDNIYYTNFTASRRIDSRSGIDGTLYANYYDTGILGSFDTFNAGAFASYYRTFGERLVGTAGLGIDAYDADNFDSQVTAAAQLGLRYHF